MTLTIEIETENAAFVADPGEECARILEHLAGQLREGYTSGVLLDSNGNSVGQFTLEEDD